MSAAKKRSRTTGKQVADRVARRLTEPEREPKWTVSLRYSAQVTVYAEDETDAVGLAEDLVSFTDLYLENWDAEPAGEKARAWNE